MKVYRHIETGSGGYTPHGPPDCPGKGSGAWAGDLLLWDQPSIPSEGASQQNPGRRVGRELVDGL